MATPVILPKFDMTMEAGTVARWLRQEGQRVEKGDPIVEVETDKVNMEVEAPASGILAGVRVEPGQTVAVTRVLAYIIQPGEAVPPTEDAAIADAAQARPPAPPHAPEVAPPAESPPPPPGVPRSPGASARLRPDVAAAPATRQLATDLGVDLAAVTGTGPGGRITEADVRAAVQPGRDLGTPLSGRRRVIAQRMTQSAREIPHFHLFRAVEMSGPAASRAEASYTAIVVWAVSRTLPAHPAMRASLQDQTMIVHDEVHIGVAVETTDGVIVPVVREADRKDLQTLHREIEVLARRAREGRLAHEDVVGGVFTVSNLGMYGLDRFTALIFPSQSALLAVGAVQPRPWIAGERVEIRPVCELTLAIDHRIADGAAGARFLSDLCRHLEQMGR